MCTHDWQPIPNWYARYRCSICQAVGCKFGVVVARHRVRSMAIEPYRCEARIGGERCNEPAVHSWNGKKFRCPAHRRPGHAARVHLVPSTGVERGTTTVERGTTAVERGTTTVERGTTAVERGTTTVERGTTAVDPGSTGV